MTARAWNRLGQLLMIAALAATGYPLVRAIWPAGPLRPHPQGTEAPRFAQIEVEAQENLTDADLQALNRQYGVDLHREYHSDNAAGQTTLLGDVPVEREDGILDRLDSDPRVVDSHPVERIEVDAKDSLTPAQLQELNDRYGLDLDYNSPEAAAASKVLVGDVDPGSEGALLEQLRKDPLVEAAEPTRLCTVPPNEVNLTPSVRTRSSLGSKPNDPLFDDQWNLQMVGAEKAWEKKATGKGIVVAVIDTGVASEEDSKCRLAQDFSGTTFAKGYDFVNHDEHPYDDHGHGTHVAGTIAETTNNALGAAGLAFEASIMPLKVLDAFGSGSTANIADAIRYAADHGAKVINMSLGGPYPDRLMENACQYAKKKGVLIVCAAGNSMGGPVGYPAAFPECLAVSSVGPTGELAFYSSIGKEVGIAAPGGDKTYGDQDGIIQNTVVEGKDDYYSFQGTSMASPHVAAAAALAMARGVTDPDEVEHLLQRAATPKKPKEKYGAGVLSASKAVELADSRRLQSMLQLIASLVAFAFGMGVGVIRKQLGGLTRFPFAPLGFVLGFLGPDLIFGWLGFGTPFNIVLHSALIPLYLLWEADSRAVYRFVGAMAIGMGIHLGWDAFTGNAPFPGILPNHGIPWLWVNAAIGVGVALVAYRRSYTSRA